jgi:two-component system sensor histidine kinase VicK
MVGSPISEKRGNGGFRWPKRFTFPIGVRLFLAFTVIIVLAGLIGFLAVQQFSALTSTTTELNTRDLPEIVKLAHLRTLLYQQRDQERTLVSLGPDQQGSTETPDTQHQQLITTSLSDVRTTVATVNQQLSSLLTLDPPVANGPSYNDTPLVNTLISGVATTTATSTKIQALIQQGQFPQASTLVTKVQVPRLMSLINVDYHLSALEQKEAARDGALVQQESTQAIFLILTLTALAVLLSILLASLITRSLTKPLLLLLRTTEAMTAGDLDVEPPVSSNDELGRLTSAYNKMRLSLRSTIMSLAQERRQTQAIIDASTDGVLLVDAGRTIVKFNPAAERLSGWKASDALGKRCWEVFGCRGTTQDEAEAHDRLCPLLHALQEHAEPSALELQVRSLAGQQRWLMVSCAPIAIENVTEQQHLVVGMHDITQLKAVEQLKSDFVSMVSHELRAPVTTVTGAVEMLEQLDVRADTEPYHEVLGILDAQTKRLRQVIEEVLEVTRFDAGRLQVHLEPVSLETFLQVIVERIRQEWGESEPTLILHPPQQDLLVWADCKLLEIVFRNLLDNARKYASLDKAIDITIESGARSQEGRALVHVIDHGPGIPPDQIEQIFERFSRGVQSSYNWTRGYGLGLYIARELMLAHNGNIWAENQQEGTCFTVALWTVVDDQPPPMVEPAVEEKQ